MRHLYLIAAALIASPAWAATKAVTKDTGSQVFHKAACVSDDELDASFDECGCEVKIEYQQLADNDAINKMLAPEADITRYCNTLLVSSLKESQADAKWEVAKAGDFKKSYFQFNSKQETTFLSPEWMNVVSYDYVFSGGAHGNTGLASTLFDVKTGKTIDFTSLLNLEKVTLVNKDIQQQLAARKQDVFPETLAAEPAFIKPDGKCDGCEYVLKNDGLYAVFQHYTVGPYSSGFIEVKLPTNFLNRPIMTMAKGS